MAVEGRTYPQREIRWLQRGGQTDALRIITPKSAPNRNGWRAEGAETPPTASPCDPVPENFFCGPRISEKRFYGRAQDGGRHFACEPVASIERSERAACTALGAGSPAHLQPPVLEPSPGDYGARKIDESPGRTRTGWPHTTEVSRACL
ncbi:hypothetical protein NDU88_000165 [Pleurodeles waltl]|uniref:Uncharacterized protein n=1 Tax=Pleurodeles waltl TaxID=8319 RepID=A0AAV7M1N2_PLEWA|nr:hypothetical protein NDU88_000165 [Pleurodeles waltl]